VSEVPRASLKQQKRIINFYKIVRAKIQDELLSMEFVLLPVFDPTALTARGITVNFTRKRKQREASEFYSKSKKVQGSKDSKMRSIPQLHASEKCGQLDTQYQTKNKSPNGSSHLSQNSSSPDSKPKDFLTPALEAYFARPQLLTQFKRISLRCSPSKGRYVIAKVPIKAGEVIFTEKALVVMSENLDRSNFFD
jgi:hypothetical protein